MNTYEDYRKEPMSLTFEEMASLHRAVVSEIDGDSEAPGYYRDLLTAAVKYMEIRSRWPLWDRDEKAENDRTRTLRHDSVITAFNLLARYLRAQGKAAAWRNTLGEESESPYYRKRIGDFACYLAFVEGLNAR